MGKGKLTKEEELLLQDFSRNVSKKSSIIFYMNAFIVSAIPIWLYWRIHMMDPVSSAVPFAIVTCVATYLVAFAYKNTKFVLKNEVAHSEATTFSLFYNNALFLMMVVVGSFLVFRSFNPTYNYALSTLGSAGIIALFSTGSQG